MFEPFTFCDEWGPEKILHVYDQRTGMKSILVIDNTSLGPGKGGIRMTSTVSLEEVIRLARTMTWKCALAELPFGGAKAGIIVDPKNMNQEEKIEMIKAFAIALRLLSPSQYVAAPDINTGEEEMAAYAIANGSLKSCTGKPGNMCVRPGEECGIPHEYGSTGFGVFCAIKVVVEHIGKELNKTSIAIDGFGNVGSFLAKYLDDSGSQIVAVSDSLGCIYNPKGLDFKKLKTVKELTKSVINYTPGKILSQKELYGIPVDIIVPASIPDVINSLTVDRINALAVVEAANIPATLEMEERLQSKGILVVPDIIANSGGVISSYAEYIGENPLHIFKKIENKIVQNTQKILKKSGEKNEVPRKSALRIAKDRVKKVLPNNK